MKIHFRNTYWQENQTQSHSASKTFKRNDGFLSNDKIISIFSAHDKILQFFYGLSFTYRYDEREDILCIVADKKTQ